MVTQPIDLSVHNVIKIHDISLSDSGFRWSTEEVTHKPQTGGLMAFSWSVILPMGYEF